MKIDDMAYARGRDDARCGLPRFPRSQHPDNYGAYNAGFRDWHKLQRFPEMLAALQQAVRWIDAGCDPSTKSVEAMRVAITLATEIEDVS